MGHSLLYNVIQLVLIQKTFHDVLARITHFIMRDVYRHKSACFPIAVIACLTGQVIRRDSKGEKKTNSYLMQLFVNSGIQGQLSRNTANYFLLSSHIRHYDTSRLD